MHKRHIGMGYGRDRRIAVRSNDDHFLRRLERQRGDGETGEPDADGNRTADRNRQAATP
jgi:hypothetical protein